MSAVPELSWISGGAIVTAYFLGAIPTSYWIVKWRQGDDVRGLGSGNPGATNVLRVVGSPEALCVLAVDLGKGVAAIALARWLGVGVSTLGAVGLAAVLGHLFPLWLGFRGGKGVATAGGVFLAFSPLAFAAGLVVFLVVVALTRWVSLGSLVAAVSVPVTMWSMSLMGARSPEARPLIAWSMLIAGLVVLRHWRNLRRLRQGREYRLGAGLGGS